MNRVDPMETDWLWSDGWMPSEGGWTEIPGTPRIPKPLFAGVDGQVWSKNSYQMAGAIVMVGYHDQPSGGQGFAQIGGNIFVPEGNIAYLDTAGTWDLDNTTLRLADDYELYEFYRHVVGEYIQSTGAIKASTGAILNFNGSVGIGGSTPISSRKYRRRCY